MKLLTDNSLRGSLNYTLGQIKLVYIYSFDII
jgi:hypothetical protein